MRTTSLTIIQPTDPGDYVKWATSLATHSRHAELVDKLAYTFLARELYDFRVRKTGPPIAPDKAHVAHRLYQAMFTGSAEDLARGFVRTDFPQVPSSYTVLPLLNDGLYLPDEGGTVRYTGAAYTDPRVLVATMLMQNGRVGPASHIFALKGTVAGPQEVCEASAYLFPYRESSSMPKAWLVFVRGCRYGDERWFLLSGDVEAWAHAHRAEPRSGDSDGVERWFGSQDDTYQNTRWPARRHDPAVKLLGSEEPAPVTLLTVYAADRALRSAASGPFLWGGE